jgi:hypothetical protein
MTTVIFRHCEARSDVAISDRRASLAMTYRASLAMTYHASLAMTCRVMRTMMVR